MNPHFSILMLSHKKPELMLQALKSVEGQTYPDWDLTIVDSGLKHSYPGVKAKIQWTMEPELPGKNVDFAIGPRLMNMFMDRLKGPWIVHLGDDDLLLENCLADYAATIKVQPAYQSFVGGQMRLCCDENGRTTRLNLTYLTSGIHHPGQMDCKVDGMQFVFHVELWKQLKAKYPAPWPEELEHVKHADGLFMERAVAICPAFPVPGIQTINRRTPFSQFCGKGQ